jgi:NodT family efflux transporter outer membrane factor (OMF) lipoprotein
VGEEIALRGQIAATGDILAAQEKQLELMEKQLAAGSLSRTETLAQKTLVEQTRTALLPMENELSRVRNQLCVLTGKFPSAADTLPEFTFEDLKMPENLPVSLPSELTRQRPDIRAQEALLHAANAKIGVATANMLPQITLNGSLGQQSNIFQKLFDSNNNVWSLGAGIAQPVFNGGSLKAKRNAAKAVYDQVRSEYRQTVLLAFKNVADSLKALEIDEALIKAQSETLASAQESLKLAEERFNAGAISYLTLLDAQRQFHQARSGLVQAQAARFADTAALFQALGGGWWNRAPVKGEKSND